MIVTQAVIDRYQAWEPIPHIAASIGVSADSLRGALVFAGVERPPISCDIKAYSVGVGDCWLFCGAVMQTGYALAGYRQQAHRVSYEHFVGAIPPDLVVDHVCHHRSCLNPAHLRLLPPLENCSRKKPGAFAAECRTRHSLGLHVHPANIARYVYQFSTEKEGAA